MPPDEPGVDQLWLWFWIWIWIWFSQRDELRAKRRDRRPESRDGDGAESDDAESDDARSNDGNGDGAESDDAKSNDGDGDGARSDGARSNDGDGDGAESDDAESDDGAESDDAESNDAKSSDGYGDGAESSDGAERKRGVEQPVGDAVEAGQADGERFVGGGQAFGHGAAGDAKRGHRAARTALPRVSSAKHLVQRFLLQRWIVGERGAAATSSEPETSSSYPVD